MVTVSVTVSDLYRSLAGGPGRTGFRAWPVTLEDGTEVAGLYRGYGRIVACRKEPSGRGFGGPANVVEPYQGLLRVRD